MIEKHDTLYGIRATLEALQGGKEVTKVIMKKGIRGELFSDLYQAAKMAQVPIQLVPNEYFSKFPGKNHQGVISFISPIEFQHAEEILTQVFERGEIPFVLVLDKVSDVRNFGAICRTAECSGVHMIIIPSKGAASVNADSMKTSAGALHHIPVCRETDLKKTLRMLKSNGLQIFGASEKSESLYYEQNFDHPLAIIMGAEDKGIAFEYRALCDAELRIPIMGRIDSLNVSVAAGILCYEVVKQRFQKS